MVSYYHLCDKLYILTAANSCYLILFEQQACRETSKRLTHVTIKPHKMDGRPGSEDLFDSIIMADNRCYVEGYHEGFEKGIRQWTLEGRRHGARHGAKVSTELFNKQKIHFQLSFYYGFAVTWKCLLQNNMDAKSRKREKALDTLLGLMEKFPHDDAQSEDLLENVGKVRAKFRQICSMLNVPTDFNDCMKAAGDTSF